MSHREKSLLANWTCRVDDQSCGRVRTRKWPGADHGMQACVGDKHIFTGTSAHGLIHQVLLQQNALARNRQSGSRHSVGATADRPSLTAQVWTRCARGFQEKGLIFRHCQCPSTGRNARRIARAKRHGNLVTLHLHTRYVSTLSPTTCVNVRISTIVGGAREQKKTEKGQNTGWRHTISSPAPHWDHWGPPDDQKLSWFICQLCPWERMRRRIETKWDRAVGGVCVGPLTVSGKGNECNWPGGIQNGLWPWSRISVCECTSMC